MDITPITDESTYPITIDITGMRVQNCCLNYDNLTPIFFFKHGVQRDTLINWALVFRCDVCATALFAPYKFATNGRVFIEGSDVKIITAFDMNAINSGKWNYIPATQKLNMTDLKIVELCLKYGLIPFDLRNGKLCDLNYFHPDSITEEFKQKYLELRPAIAPDETVYADTVKEETDSNDEFKFEPIDNEDPIPDTPLTHDEIIASAAEVIPGIEITPESEKLKVSTKMFRNIQVYYLRRKLKQEPNPSDIEFIELFTNTFHVPIPETEQELMEKYITIGDIVYIHSALGPMDAEEYKEYTDKLTMENLKQELADIDKPACTEYYTNIEILSEDECGDITTTTLSIYHSGVFELKDTYVKMDPNCGSELVVGNGIMSPDGNGCKCLIFNECKAMGHTYPKLQIVIPGNKKHPNKWHVSIDSRS